MHLLTMGSKAMFRVQSRRPVKRTPGPRTRSIMNYGAYWRRRLMEKRQSNFPNHSSEVLSKTTVDRPVTRHFASFGKNYYASPLCAF